MDITRVSFTISLIGITHTLAFDPTLLWLKLLTVKGVYGYGYVNNNKKNTHICDLAIALMKKMPDIDTDIDTMVPHILSIEQYKVMVEEIQKKDCIDHLK